MIYPAQKDYARLAQEFDVVPVYREILADTETPVSVLERFADRENAFLLESMEGGEKWGRYSFVGVEPELLLEADHSGPATGALEALRDVYRELKVAEVAGLPRFFGGTVGFLGYESVGEFERMPEPKPGDGTVIPRSRFLKADRIIVFDNILHTVKIVVCTRPGVRGSASAKAVADKQESGVRGEETGKAYEEAVAEIDRIAGIIEAPLARRAADGMAEVKFGSNMAPEDYRAIVKRAKEYIVAGDIIQVVLSQRFSATAPIPPLQLYRALRFLNPSPYTFFLKIGEQTLVGSSPEVMVRLTGDRVELRPIAGTRPRGKNPEEDRALAEELQADEKERAEHVMLVDLGRNDVGRVAVSGSVEVTEYMVIERYSHVMHLVSHVQGALRDGCDAYDVIQATFPAGTLSGAPKIRAMEIIHELEPGPRGVYGGAVGYISYNGNMDLAITIRTLDISGDRVSIQAGAGIVFDSDPQREFEETCHKAAAMKKAVQMAARGLEIR